MSLEKLQRKLIQTRATTLALIADLDETTLRTTFVDEVWTLFDLLAHLAHSEVDHLQTITGDRVTIEAMMASFDLDEWNRTQVARLRSLTREALLARLEAARAETLRLLARMEEAELQRLILHPVFGEVEVGKILRIIAMHERMHQQDIRRALHLGEE